MNRGLVFLCRETYFVVGSLFWYTTWLVYVIFPSFYKIIYLIKKKKKRRRRDCLLILYVFFLLQVDENNRLRTELQKKILEVEKYVSKIQICCYFMVQSCLIRYILWFRNMVHSEYHCFDYLLSSIALLLVAFTRIHFFVCC